MKLLITVLISAAVASGATLFATGKSAEDVAETARLACLIHKQREMTENCDSPQQIAAVLARPTRESFATILRNAAGWVAEQF